MRILIEAIFSSLRLNSCSDHRYFGPGVPRSRDRRELIAPADGRSRRSSGTTASACRAPGHHSAAASDGSGHLMPGGQHPTNRCSKHSQDSPTTSAAAPCCSVAARSQSCTALHCRLLEAGWSQHHQHGSCCCTRTDTAVCVCARSCNDESSAAPAELHRAEWPHHATVREAAARRDHRRPSQGE